MDLISPLSFPALSSSCTLDGDDQLLVQRMNEIHFVTKKTDLSFRAGEVCGVFGEN
jgi:hypothetical protein